MSAEETNFFLQNATKNECYEKCYEYYETSEYKDTVEKAIAKYETHHIILLIKNTIRGLTLFLFKEASLEV